MKTPLELLEEIRKDFVEKHDGDPTIDRICKTVINEFKSREKQLMRDKEICPRCGDLLMNQVASDNLQCVNCGENVKENKTPAFINSLKKY